MFELLLYGVFCIHIVKVLLKYEKEEREDQNEQEAVEYSRRPLAPSAEMLRMRASRRHLIQKWVNVIKKRGYPVHSWIFLPDSWKRIALLCEDGSEIIGSLSFICNDGNPRVSMFISDGGQRIAGVRWQKANMEALIQTAREEMQEVRRIGYINLILQEVARNGEANFSILTYEGMSEKAYLLKYGKMEIKALCSALSDYLQIKEIKREEGLILVKAKVNPGTV